LLDLFCGAGGAAMGYHRAGFDVVGVDLAPQPRYPFEFHQASAMTFDLTGYDVIHASPPCQKHSTLKHRTGLEYACFIEPIRRRLKDWGGVWVLENVVGAPLIKPVLVCGSVFGLGVRRHRLFESNVSIFGAGCNHAGQPAPIDVSGTGARRLGPRTDGKGGDSRKPRNLEEARDVMGIDWMTRKELSQAIPPAYTEWIGLQLRAALLLRVAA
jgi:DNA (cytosine-5)-methyltransferase 1